ncbi:solute carrier family 25 protein [archaeon]|nr:MAG: solute carrier family 25 protein [archaeon]
MKSFYHQSNARNMSTQLPFRDILLSSVVAGSVASFLTTPLDIAKLRFQTQLNTLSSTHDVRYRGLFHALYVLYGKFGVQGLFRGAMARVLFHTPSTAITMACYEEMKTWWKAVLP